MPNQYPPALREQIVLEYRQGRSIRALANDYEPCEATIRQWDGCIVPLKKMPRISSLTLCDLCSSSSGFCFAPSDASISSAIRHQCSRMLMPTDASQVAYLRDPLRSKL